MKTLGYGQQAGLSARAGLWIVLALLVASLVLLSGLFDSTQARARTQGTWCERTGSHASGLAMVSDNGGTTWEKP